MDAIYPQINGTGQSKEHRILYLATLLFIAVFMSSCSTKEAGQPAKEDDYLSPSLRVEVEALKRAVKEQPTDESTIAKRAAVLADWIDAYSLAGGEVGVEPTRIQLQSTLPPTGELAVQQSRLVDKFVREFTLHDEEGALGFLTADNLGPFEAGSLASISQTWRVGKRPVTVGGGFWVARHFNANFGPFQADDPTGTGYVSLQSTDDDAEFAVETIMASGPHGGFRAPEPAIAFRLVSGELDSGSAVTITYGDQSQGGSGVRVSTIESERMPLPLYVDLDGSGEWRPLPITPFIIGESEIAGVHGFDPSTVEPDEVFEISVRAEDRFSTGPRGTYQHLMS